MSRTDPIADFATVIRNGLHARHTVVEDHYSKMREAIARVLAAEGFIEGVEVRGEGARRRLVVHLKYRDNNEPAIHEIRRISKPSVRRYAGVQELPRIKNGLGVTVLTTPQGVMTDRQARRLKVGGELLLAVW